MELLAAMVRKIGEMTFRRTFSDFWILTIRSVILAQETHELNRPAARGRDLRCYNRHWPQKIAILPGLSARNQFAHPILDPPIKGLLEHHLGGSRRNFVELRRRKRPFPFQHGGHPCEFVCHCFGTPFQAAEFRMLADGMRGPRPRRTHRKQQRQARRHPAILVVVPIKMPGTCRTRDGEYGQVSRHET